MAKITVVGGINIDIEGSPFEKLKYHDSNPGRINLAFGGVGRNIAENAARLGGDVAMVSVIGDDQMGKAAKMELEDLGVDTSCIRTLQGRNSAMYLSILHVVTIISWQSPHGILSPTLCRADNAGCRHPSSL